MHRLRSSVLRPSVLRPSVLACALLCACSAEAPCAPATLAPLDEDPRFAVVLTDYASSAIALLDAEGEVITEAWLDSGTRGTGLAAGLTGDLFVPGADGSGRLAILERYGRDVLSLIERDGTVSQIDLRGDGATPSGHSPNPQDAIFTAAGAWITRYNPALDPSVPELARGDDVVRVDVQRGEIAARIDLAADVTLPDGTIVYARPGPLVARHGDRVAAIALARASIDYQASATGAIATIDLEAGAPADLVEIEGTTGCLELEAVPTDDARAIVLCTGDAFEGTDARREQAAIATVAIDPDGTIVLESIWRARDHADAPVPASGLVPLDATRALAVADPRGDDPGSGRDVLVLVDLASGATTPILESEEDAFVLGVGALDPDTGLVVIPDAERRVVHHLATRGAVEIRGSAALPTCRALPPRQVAVLR